MPGAQITVPYLQLDAEHGFEEGADDRGPYATVPYLVAWNQRFQFVNQVVGVGSYSGSPQAGVWIRNLAFQYPPSPNMYATGARIVGEGSIVPQAGQFQNIIYDQAIVLVTFRIPTWSYQQTDDPSFLASLSADPTENQALLFATQELDLSSEIITIPESSSVFASDGAKTNAPYAVRVLVMQMNITWHKFPVMPMGIIQNYADSVNASTFLGCARGTVHFLGPKTIREANVDGSITQKVMVSFRWRQKDWNQALRPDGITWDTVQDGSARTFYQYKDFSGILQFFSGVTQ